jgi:NodT family efflux transporter outer membrane factor (OMF) lipoprotein
MVSSTFHKSLLDNAQREGSIRSRGDPSGVRAVFAILTRFVPGMVAFALLVSGCSHLPMVGPDYTRPSAPEAEEWIERDDPKIKSEPTDLSTWWKVFDDPVLDTLIETAYQQNLPLQIAGIRILEARAQLGIAVGGMFPQQQQGRGAYTRVNMSEHAANTSPALDFAYGEIDLGFDAAWELDFWGKFRRSIESSLGNLEASIASYDDILVTLTAEVARTYVLIRTLEERLVIARENVKIQERSLRIAEARFEGGEVTELDVQQAKSLLGSTQALIPRLQASLRQAKNGLSILLGKLPGEVDQILGESKAIPTVPPEVGVGVPAELLRRRPDIRLAERQLATQSPRIGVAKADLYPHFVLFGSIGIRSSDAALTAAGGLSGSTFSDLWDSDSIEFFGGPAFKWDILNYGRIKNRVRVQDARFQQLVANYQNTVLRAAQEVEDAMAAFLRTQEEAGFLSNSVAAAARSVELSLIQYREGLVDYQRVLDTQRFLAQDQDLLTATTGSVALNLVAIYKALGGGWQIRAGKDFVPDETKAEMRERTGWGKLLEQEKLEPPSEEDRKKLRWPDW